MPKSKSDQSETMMERNLRHLEAEQKFFEVSLSDIVVSDLYKEKCSDGSCTQEDLERFLWYFGLDTNKEVEQQFLPHRNWQGKVVTCARWVGTRRTDDEWKQFIKGNVEMYQN